MLFAICNSMSFYLRPNRKLLTIYGIYAVEIVLKEKWVLAQMSILSKAHC